MLYIYPAGAPLPNTSCVVTYCVQYKYSGIQRKSRMNQGKDLTGEVYVRASLNVTRFHLKSDVPKTGRYDIAEVSQELELN